MQLAQLSTSKLLPLKLPGGPGSLPPPSLPPSLSPSLSTPPAPSLLSSLPAPSPPSPPGVVGTPAQPLASLPPPPLSPSLHELPRSEQLLSDDPTDRQTHGLPDPQDCQPASLCPPLPLLR